MARAKLQKPTDGELSILQVLWRRGPSTVREVCDELNKKHQLRKLTLQAVWCFRNRQTERTFSDPSKGRVNLQSVLPGMLFGRKSCSFNKIHYGYGAVFEFLAGFAGDF